MEHRFQINLRGVIDILSKHLYSGPEVYVRELLQNATDAIQARRKLDRDHQGDIHFEVHQPAGKPPSLVISDNGIGLTPDEVHTFLSTIGLSSKRAAEGDRPTDFLGQFGIGILSCFVVSDSIVVYSRSARERTAVVEWRAKPDGTYTLRELDRDMSPGTQVWLTAKPGSEELFDPDRVRDLCRHYGGLLPYPIRATFGKSTDVVNDRGAPWRQEYASERERRRALLQFGRDTFGTDFLDAIPLESTVGDVDGVAYVLPYTASLAGRRTHRVYLKNMLLSETAENLLPDWAFFVKALVNANDLRPTASRESFYEDDKLATARDTLGDCLRRYLCDLGENDPQKLGRLLGLHALAIKSLATQDDEFYRIVIDWLPFETSLGDMTFGEFRKNHDVVRFVPTVDQFRQVARVAQAQGLTVINAGYTYDIELLVRAGRLLDLPVEPLDSGALSHSFDELTLDELERTAAFLDACQTVLSPFQCEPEVKRYKPPELPALYTTTGEGRFYRSLEQSREIASPLWSGVLESMGRKERSQEHHSCLCFNYDNPLVRRLTSVRDRAVLHRSIQMLYLQALLLGHHPLSNKEMQLLNDGMLSLIEWGIGLQEGPAK